MADNEYRNHPSLYFGHEKEIDIEVEVAKPSTYIYNDEKYADTKHPIDLTVLSIDSIGSLTATAGGGKSGQPKTEVPVEVGSTYSWWPRHAQFKKIIEKDCNSEGSTFVLTRSGGEDQKSSTYKLLRCRSAGPNVDSHGSGSSPEANGHASDSNGHSSGHASGHSNGSSNGHTTPPMDSGERLKNILGIGVELYVIVDRFLKSEHVAQINNERGFEYGVDEYLKLFHFFQFKYKDGFGHVQKPFLDSFNDDFPLIEEAIAKQADAYKAKAEVDKIKEEEAKEEEAKAVEEKPVSANGASSAEDDLPF